LSQRAIARRLGVDRATVARALRSMGPPSYARPPVAASAWLAVEPMVRALLAEFPDMPASVVGERVGWTGSASWLRENVARVRPEYRRVDPVDRLAHLAGEEIQCDLWFPPVGVPVGGGSVARLPVLVMVASYSRFVAAVMVPSKQTGDLLAGMWHLLRDVFGGVPKRLLWDNEAGIGRAGKPADGVAAWCGTVGVRLVQAKPFDPETKGIVERANGYLETSFMPGRGFSCPEDFNTQLGGWLTHRANQRTVRATGRRPCDAVGEDRRVMGVLPPVEPGCWPIKVVRLPREYYVRVAGNDYSVDPQAIERIVHVRVDLDKVDVNCQGRLVASHDRCWAKHQTITDPAHVAQALVLREEYQHPRPVESQEDLSRDLADYDKAFGVDVADLETKPVTDLVGVA
jgi:transposase